MYTFNKAPAAHILNDIPEDGIIVFSWGEIDCRCHVNKHQPWEETVDKLAQGYLDMIREITRGFNQEIWIYNVVPPARKGLFVESAGFPLVGTDAERLSYVKRLNDHLRASEFVFVDVFNEYADEDGLLRHEMSDGHVHIADEKPLQNWINRRFENASA